MEFEKSVPFKNWTTEVFEQIYGGDAYKFEAGAVYNVPTSMAIFFAKKLAVRELHKLGTVKGEMLADPDVKVNIDKCFPVKPTSQAASNSFERIDEISIDAKAEPAKEIADANKTVEDEQKDGVEPDDEDNNAPDEKNNAGAPVFKKSVGRPRKDAQYTK